MGKIVIGILIICLYCFPFVYISMDQDYSNHSMLGYLIMIIATSLLAFFGKLFINSLSPIIGNLLSVIISFYFINGMAGNEHWDGYFKPLTPYQLLVLVSFLNLIPQFLAINFAKKLKNKVNEV
ncbi:hypothetical protein P9E76_10240 [Schinkia azotoformans]|uniref:Uncharacterized protein n=1 Tax=Schinkia azotoformans LMG 9581 TaxID=1131731 RepID=K6D768_SCHAZ|nr:hypothetical protein [Schinkia azotoformans]EKN64134.1 hypothetical protein BAZO_14829 [Schinkia azotoformans LMG 9581]MEC1637133.1 hypothetical protein [Schinkia azotoformans]MEC1945421.1 hypothetical protein [Schinkia azotoformans]